MSTKIAFIGSGESLTRIQPVAANLLDIEIDPYIYQEPQEAADLVTQIKPCDVVLFAGALAYYFSKKQLESLPIPCIYLATDEMAVASSFLSILYTKHITLERISIDMIDSSVVYNVLTEFESDVSKMHVLDYQNMLESHFDLGKIVTFHKKLWDQGKIDLALTSVHAVYHRLESLGIPAMRLTDPKFSLRRCLEIARAEAELFKRKSAQVAVGYINAAVLDEQPNALIHELPAPIQRLEDGLFVFYSTRGEIEALIGQNQFYDFMNNWDEPIKMGIGYGATFIDAEQNAKAALKFSEKDADSKCWYILTEEKQLLGPFPHENRQHQLKNDHPEIVQIAKQTRLSPGNLSKMIEFSKSRKDVHFTAADLADYLKVTRRSTERILKKLADHSYVKVVGEEMTYQQGRPRAIYELNMPVYR
ncbi:helix-turn-helix domain-containing protein [Neobacillus mesonae]|uniref:transcriptional regulator n=1 Tax=Neobacillus mesonae TaxID=1193713 RepID=UPI0008332B3C|nr:transcriptional regulator [Neobacillus mesonae]